MPARMKLAKYIANLGYGSRREAEAYVARGHVTRRDGSVLSEGDVFQHDDMLIDGEPLDPAPGSIIMMHKPVGYVTATKGREDLVYDLLPKRFLLRSPVMAPIGRLDLASSGLLLLTDDGKINHRITSPRTHLPKVYEVHLAEDLADNAVEVLSKGTMLLESDVVPLKPVKLEVLAPRHVRVTLTEGRYHQVRRMFAALGNHVTALHRTAIGNLELGDLPEGEWRELTPEQRALLLG
jgi:16S rRNA pseudouridine516 synthase